MDGMTWQNTAETWSDVLTISMAGFIVEPIGHSPQSGHGYDTKIYWIA